MAGNHGTPMRAKPPTTPPPAPGSNPSTDWSNANQSAYDLMLGTLKDWGLESLAPDLKSFILQGLDGASLALALRGTQAYKLRFKGNEARRAAGLPELSPAEYIAIEAQYNHLLRAYGLPEGFYDSHDDFAGFIGSDLSPDELKDRLQIYHDEYENAPVEVKNLWSQYFGKGDVIAGLIDPTKAQQVLLDRAAQLGIAGEAAKQGFQITPDRAKRFQQYGVTLEGARRAYQQIGQVFGTDQQIANRFGQQFGQEQEEASLLLGDGDAANLRQSLYSQEQGLFRQSGAIDANTLSVNPVN